MENKYEFPDGIFAKAPPDGAPDFVKTKLQILLEEFIPWLNAKKESGEKWVTLDIKEAASGKWYASVNDWKPKEEANIPAVEDDDLPW